ncbi:MAG TPA: TetR/AcrR family transcriptional regulator [Terriglobales bacterium]|nr:TetR/AcrR family transcriptional regulator [Terriglobales bacterium]
MKHDRSVRLARPSRHYTTPRGEQTRQDILRSAADIASADGLEGLSIGHLASELGMSKSGLFSHFGSKEELQLAVVESAREIFMQEVVNRAGGCEPGVPRLYATLEAWLACIERHTFRGGCFFAAVSAEFDSRSGPVREKIVSLMRAWYVAIRGEVQRAQSLGQISLEHDPAQIGFELVALVHEANTVYQLLGQEDVFERARRGILGRLRSAATPGGSEILASLSELQVAIGQAS